jgi:hypothetical protein
MIYSYKTDYSESAAITNKLSDYINVILILIIQYTLKGTR